MSIRRSGQQKTLRCYCLPVFHSKYWADCSLASTRTAGDCLTNLPTQTVEKSVQTLGVPQHPMNLTNWIGLASARSSKENGDNANHRIRVSTAGRTRAVGSGGGERPA